MKTDDLVTLLARSAAVAPAPRSLVHAIGSGVAGSAILMMLVLGANRDLGSSVQLAVFIEKMLFVGSVAAIALLAVRRLSRPGAVIDGILPLLALPMLAMLLLGGIALGSAAPGQREDLLYGETWAFCPALIALLSIPVFASTLWAMQDMAPTRPGLAGAAAGLFSGAVGALVYSFHCPETGTPFIASWYLLGILVPAAFGGMFGHRLLRW